MKIKAKLSFGIGFLFAMIAIITIISIVYTNKLRTDTGSILVANYNSLDYLRKMQLGLDNGLNQPANSKLFRENLALQQKNITELGEGDLTDSLTSSYATLLQQQLDTIGERNLRKYISDVMLLNMQAIERKSDVARSTADSSIFWITVTGTICLIIALTMLFNLPGYIANPIKKLTASIKEIAAQNYKQRVHFSNQDEFGELATAFNSMAEKLEEYKAGNLEKLLVEKKRIETLINNMKDPVIGLDENKQVLFMNDIALKVTGLQLENVMGKGIETIAKQNDLVRMLVQGMFDETEKKDNSKPVKIYANNKESYFEKEIIPIKIIPTGEQLEKQIGTVILLQNITSYKELDFAKTNFIATISHELKTPIASVKMSLQLLEDARVGELNPEQISLVESIKDDAGRLLKIIGELLNMAQVESGSLQLNIVPTEVSSVLDYAVNANRTAAEQKQIRFVISKPGSVPNILADNEKTSWVLTNLISNALRYSYENSMIDINVIQEKDKVRFSVTDTGQGISTQYLDKIFNRYFRIPGTRKEGTGLGLSISKEFIEAQGGEISVSSEFGAGSTFSFTVNCV